MLGANSDDHDIFVRRDDVGILSTITYSEVGPEDTACADDYILIRKPEGFSFSENNNLGSLTLSGSAELFVEYIQVHNGDLIFILSDPLPAQSQLIIDGIQIDFDETEVGETYLEVDVNQFLNSGDTDADTQMQDNNHIRIGDPKINVASNQIFLRSEAGTQSDRLVMSDITIEEGTVPVMNPQDDIVIHMPENLEIVTESENINYEVLLDLNKIDSVTPTSTQIRIQLSEELAPGEIITIKDLRVQAKADTDNTSQSDISDNESAFLAIEVNDRNENPASFDYYSNNFSAVDELSFDFDTYSDQIYVLSDMGISGYMLMDGLLIDAEHGGYTGQDGNNYYTLLDLSLIHI